MFFKENDMNSLRKESSENSFLSYIVAVLLIACASATGAVEAPIATKLVLSSK
jgi:hypothetical protein